MPETRVVDCILSDFDDGPRSGKEERAGEEAAKWARCFPHVCEHKCLATTKRCRWSSEEGVEDLISDSGNDHNNGKASFSESHYLFTCSVDGAYCSLSLSLSFIKLISANDDVFHACHDLIPSSKGNQFRTKLCFYLSHPAMKPRVIFKFLYNFSMTVPIYTAPSSEANHL
jgi:hypothetical protein